jgi:hypothetical protein
MAMLLLLFKKKKIRLVLPPNFGWFGLSLRQDDDGTAGT